MVQDSGNIKEYGNLLGHFRALGEPLARQLNEVDELNDDPNFLKATLTRSNAENGLLKFSFNPGRKWQYQSYSRGGREDHLFTVYYVVSGNVCGIAESSAFRLVTAPKRPRYPVLFDEGILINKKLLLLSSNRGHQEEVNNTKKLKLSNSIETPIDKGSLFGVDCCHSPTLYSFDDKDDLFDLCWHGLGWIGDEEEL